MKDLPAAAGLEDVRRARRWVAGLIAMALALAAALAAAVYFAPVPVPGTPISNGARDGPEPEALAREHNCAACHPMAASELEGRAPTLALAATRAPLRLADPSYMGKAETVDAYLLEAIIDHCAYVVQGYACDDVPNFGLWLSPEQAQALAIWVLELE